MPHNYTRERTKIGLAEVVVAGLWTRQWNGLMGLCIGWRSVSTRGTGLCQHARNGWLLVDKNYRCVIRWRECDEEPDGDDLRNLPWFFSNSRVKICPNSLQQRLDYIFCIHSAEIQISTKSCWEMFSVFQISFRAKGNTKIRVYNHSEVEGNSACTV